jgi:hypothetical protein
MTSNNKDITDVHGLFYAIWKCVSNIMYNRFSSPAMRTIYKLGRLYNLRKTGGFVFDSIDTCYDFNAVMVACKEKYDPMDNNKIVTHGEYASYLGFINVLGLMREIIDEYNDARIKIPLEMYCPIIKTIDVDIVSIDDFRNGMLKCTYNAGNHTFKSFDDYKNECQPREITRYDHYYYDFMRITLPPVPRALQ